MENAISTPCSNGLRASIAVHISAKPDGESDTESTLGMMELDNDNWIQTFESNRFVKYHSQFLRNRSYWRELRKMQKESLADVGLLIEFLKRKVHRIRQLSDTWKSFCASETEEFHALKKSHAALSYHNTGEMACERIQDAEASSQRQLQEIIDQVEHQVIPQSMESLKAFAKAVDELGEKGNACLFACMLVEHKVNYYYSALVATSSHSTSNSEAMLVDRDRFVLVVRYYTAVQRQRKLIEKTNQHFRVFFQTAKELEIHRLSLISRIADHYLAKVADALQKMSLCNKTAIDSLKSLPQHVSTSQRPFADELDRRVRDLHPQENGDFERVAALQLQQRFGQFLSTPISSFEPPSALDLLQYSKQSLRRVFVCHQEEVGYILSSWTLVIIVVTAAGYLHIVKYPGVGEDLQLPIAAVFSKSLEETKLCFEEDVCSARLVAVPSDSAHYASTASNTNYQLGGGKIAHIGKSEASQSTSTTNTVASASSTSSTSSNTVEGAATHHWLNETWRKLMHQIHIEDLDRGRDEDSWLRLIQQHFDRINVPAAENASVDNREDLFRITSSYDLRQCSVALRPSAIASENVIEIIETVVDNTSFFVFSRTTERRLTLKTRIQQDAIQLVSLIQAARTSPNIPPSSPRDGTVLFNDQASNLGRVSPSDGGDGRSLSSAAILHLPKDSNPATPPTHSEMSEASLTLPIAPND